MSSKRIVVIGAGPIGLEAALYGLALGHDVHVLEKGLVGQNVRDWGHVRLFSPWLINHSPLGAETLQKVGIELPRPDDYLTGNEYVERYLRPLARSAHLEGRLRERTEVLHVGRDGIGKREPIGGSRQNHPFRILILGPKGEEEMMKAEVVLDCTGTYSNPNWMGNGNIPALGERELRDRIDYQLVDVAGAARARYEGKRVLLVGSGHSAATALDDLARLDGTSVVWVTRTRGKSPLALVPDDPLPERARLAIKANTMASGSDPRVQYRPSTEVERLTSKGNGFEVTLRNTETTETVCVDRILAHVGFSPDNRIYRELQVHECYASLGPMKLSAALLAEHSAGTADCLAQTSKGADVLENPEPGFFILGAKSYGKNSNFLIRIGIQQVQEVFSLIEGRPDLNLYRP